MIQVVGYGAVLRLARQRRQMKQTHAAELLGVTQGTLSRWENGSIALSETRLVDLLSTLERGAGSKSGVDRSLRRLVEDSRRPVHLIHDLTHELLAASTLRWQQWGRTKTDLTGTSLLRFETEELAAAEKALGEMGWHIGSHSRAVFGATAGSRQCFLPIQRGWFLWERLVLDDGTPVRLCSTYLRAEHLPPEGMPITLS